MNLTFAMLEAFTRRLRNDLLWGVYDNPQALDLSWYYNPNRKLKYRPHRRTKGGKRKPYAMRKGGRP